ncbi:MAG: hypothetical protein GWP91_24440 [Rhodobacterales bacterium]|nr:hypothetical protein [Rhodobacterales bacterium]
MGSGLSGPTTADAAAVHWNPAMLTHLKRGQVMGGLGLIGGVISYTRVRTGNYQIADSLQFSQPVPSEYIDPSRRGFDDKVTTTPFAPSGDLFVATSKIGGRWVFGFGTAVPYAAPLNFPEDGPQRFQLQQAFIVATQTTGSVAVELSDVFSLGAGISLVSGLASISKVQDFAGVDPFHDALANPPINQDNPFGLDAPSTVRELDVLARPFTFTDGQSIGVDFNVGLAIQPSDKLTFGFSYQHGSRLKFKGDFAMDMDHPFFTTDLAAQGLAYDAFITGEGELSFRLPNRIVAGSSVALSDKVAMDTQFSWIRYSVLDSFALTLTSPQLAQPAIGLPDTFSVTLPRDWVDTFHVENRFAAQLSPSFLGAFTVGYHSPASPDSTIDVSSPDGHRLIGATTGKLGLSDRTDLVTDLEVQGILPRDVTESDFDLGNGRYSIVLVSAFVHLQLALGSNP